MKRENLKSSTRKGKLIKSAASIVLAGMIMVTLAGCGGGAGSKAQDSQASAEPGKAASKKVKLSIGGPLPDSTPSGKGIELLTKKINEYSNGTLEATVYHNGTLGNSTSLVEGLQQGTVDIGVTGDSYFSGLVPEIQVFELPYMFQNRDEANKAFTGAVAGEIKTKMEQKGIKGLDFWGIGFRELTNSVRAVKTPEDAKGLKLRTLPAPVQVKLWELLGALSTPIDSAEVYTALQQKTVDGQENLVSDIYSNKYYEVQKYMTLTNHVFTPFFLGMSTKTWEKLDDSQREAVTKAVKDATELVKVEADKVEKHNIEELSKIMTVEKNPDIAAFKNKALGAYEVFTSKYGKDYIDRINKELGK